MTMTLAADGAHATISIHLPAATTEDVETLIHELATLRQEMTPEVPRSRPQHVLLINEPEVKMKISDDGLIAFLVRSSGLGWLSIPFTRRDSNLTIVTCAGAAREMKDDITAASPAGGNA